LESRILSAVGERLPGLHRDFDHAVLETLEGWCKVAGQISIRGGGRRAVLGSGLIPALAEAWEVGNQKRESVGLDRRQPPREFAHILK